MAFENGEAVTELEITKSKRPKYHTGTFVRFWPDEKYFDQPKFSIRALKHILKAKAVLAAGLKIILDDQINKERVEWQFENGLQDYINEVTQDKVILPEVAFAGAGKGDNVFCDYVAFA